MATSPTVHTPSRTSTSNSDDATAHGEDTSEVTKLFHERLQAYKHACGYLEEYIKSTEKMQAAHSKEYEKVLKTINQPLKEGDMFDRNLGGIAEMFDCIRQNTLAISNSHTETAKTLDQGVLPLFKRLHSEIKNKQSELAKGVGKAGKAVDKARADTNKHVERLGQASSTYETAMHKPDAYSDPYVLHRGVFYRLNKQLQEENSTRQDMLVVQENFSQFEDHVIKSFQTGMVSFMQAVSGQAEQQKQFYGTMTQKTQAIHPLFEWNGFIQRNSHILIDPNAAPKTLQNTTFPNKDHRSTQPLVQGSLERKGGLLSKFSASYYVVTPAKFLHQYSSDDDLSKDPTPDLSLYLPDCTIGNLDGSLFTVKGKDISSTMSKLGGGKEYQFRARTAGDAETWWGIIRGIAGTMPSSEPSSPLAPAARSPSQRMASNPPQTEGTVAAAAPAAAPVAAVPIETPVAASPAATPAAATAAPPAAAPAAMPAASQEAVVPASSASAEAAQAQGIPIHPKPPA